MADDPRCVPKLSPERSAELFREVLIPAVTADLNHEHDEARRILREQHSNDIIELLFGTYVMTVVHVNVSRGIDPIESVRQTAIAAARGDLDE